MNKEDYVQLHTLLAKLKFELEIELLELNSEYVKEQLEAVNKVMRIFIVECD